MILHKPSNAFWSGLVEVQNLCKKYVFVSKILQRLDLIMSRLKTLFFIPVVLFSLVILTGCVTKQEHEDTLSSWYGSTEEELVASWGVPTSFYELDGKRYLTYSNSSQAMVGGTAPITTYDYFGNAYTSGGSPPILVTSNCTITMVVDDGVINEWRYEGNNCYDY